MQKFPNNKEWGKFTSKDAEPEYAKIAHIIDGKQVFNPTAEQYIALGYKRVKKSPEPEHAEGYSISFVWAEDENEIYKKWIIEKLPDPIIYDVEESSEIYESEEFNEIYKFEEHNCITEEFVGYINEENEHIFTENDSIVNVEHSMQEEVNDKV